MKTDDLIQLGALAVVGYLAWQKFAKVSPSTQAGVGTTSKPVSTVLLPDFGEAPDASWDDSGSTSGIGFVQAIVGSVL